MILKDKCILITGGKGSIGSSIASELSKYGARVILLDMKESDEQDYYSVDLCDEEAVERVLEHIETVDVLINTAGEIYSEPCINVLKGEHHNRENWDRILANNLTSCFNMSVQVAEKMARKRTKGLIINFSSIAANGNAGQIAYSAAKGGIESITKTMAKELGLYKIRCVAISPGFIDTPSTHVALPSSIIDYYKKNTPMRTLGHTEDIVETVKYIISCDYLTGCVIPVDGALRL